MIPRKMATPRMSAPHARGLKLPVCRRRLGTTASSAPHLWALKRRTSLGRVLAGNPSGARWVLPRALLQAARRCGTTATSGVAIAARVIAAGPRPWRLRGRDSATALEHASSDAALILSGDRPDTLWGPACRPTWPGGVAIHEESILEVLLGDPQPRPQIRRRAPSTTTCRCRRHTCLEARSADPSVWRACRHSGR